MFIDRVLFTDRDNVSTKVEFEENQIPWLERSPPSFIFYNGKLWRFTGMGINSYFYHEEKSFVKIHQAP
jgi:hypothetical protein